MLWPQIMAGKDQWLMVQCWIAAACLNQQAMVSMHVFGLLLYCGVPAPLFTTFTVPQVQGMLLISSCLPCISNSRLLRNVLSACVQVAPLLRRAVPAPLFTTIALPHLQGMLLLGTPARQVK
jgi:hypothetical protein